MDPAAPAGWGIKMIPHSIPNQNLRMNRQAGLLRHGSFKADIERKNNMRAGLREFNRQELYAS
jgi:hypothetical protein